MGIAQINNPTIHPPIWSSFLEVKTTFNAYDRNKHTHTLLRSTRNKTSFSTDVLKPPFSEYWACVKYKIISQDHCIIRSSDVNFFHDIQNEDENAILLHCIIRSSDVNVFMTSKIKMRMLFCYTALSEAVTSIFS